LRAVDGHDCKATDAARDISNVYAIAASIRASAIDVEWGLRPTAGGRVLAPYAASESATRRIHAWQQDGKYVVVRRVTGRWVDAP
jgi:hypothetical protein